VRRDPLLPLYLVNLVGALGFSIVLPFLVFLIEDFGGNAFVYGLVGATYPAFQFIGAPVLGRWSDRMGRRRVLVISQIGTVASWMLFGVAVLVPVTELGEVSAPLLGDFTVTVPLLIVFLARAIDGSTGGNVSVANAYIADRSTPETRARNFGRMGVAFSAGMIGGPALASLLGAVDPSTTLPVAAALAISLVTLAIIWFGLPESTPCGGDLVELDSDEVSAQEIAGREYRDCHYAAMADELDRRSVWERPGIRFTLALQFAVLLAFNLFYATFPVHAAVELGWSVREVGVYFAVLSALLVVVEGPMLERISAHLSEWALTGIGLALLAGHFVVLIAARGDAVYLAAVLFALGNGIMWPSVSAFLSSLASEDIQGTVQGIAGSVSSLASIIGLIVGGALFAAVDVGVFALAGVLMLASAVLAVHLRTYTPSAV
jgi:DHA1 family tetracycline resistance protein-like MFS transporter